MKWFTLLVSWVDSEKKKISMNREALYEFANWLSHGIGLLFGIPAGLWLLSVGWNTQTLPGFFALLIFVFSFNLLYTSSTIYHYMAGHSKQNLFRKLDHISIFFMIAGTYTPFLIIYMNDIVGEIYLVFLWSLVVIGIFYKIFLLGRFRWVSLLLYLFMGWMMVFNFSAFSSKLPTLCFQWIIAGGLFYTLGVVFYVWKKLPFNHLIWHVFVFGGSLSHFVAVYHCIK